MQKLHGVSGNEDPLSTRPVFLFALWLGILVIITGVGGGVKTHIWSSPPEGQFAGFSLLEHSSRNEEVFPTLLAAQTQWQEKNVTEEQTEEEKSILELEQEIAVLVSGYPIEAMVPHIAKQDRRVAAFLVGIAKKESDWGKHVPTQNGNDCYNYWGYKGAGSLGHGMGYGCFATPEEAVAIVGGRMHTLVIENHNKTPRDMVIWKCGSRSCAGHAPGSAEKWIRDVDIYYSRLVAINR